jgi:hypothetical protein
MAREEREAVEKGEQPLNALLARWVFVGEREIRKGLKE